MDGADQGSSPLLWANRLWRSFRGVKATLANNDSGCLPRSFWKAFSSGWWPTWKLFDWVFYCRASRWNLTRNKDPTSYHISRHHQHKCGWSRKKINSTGNDFILLFSHYYHDYKFEFQSNFWHVRASLQRVLQPISASVFAKYLFKKCRKDEKKEFAIIVLKILYLVIVANVHNYLWLRIFRIQLQMM